MPCHEKNGASLKISFVFAKYIFIKKTFFGGGFHSNEIAYYDDNDNHDE